MVFPEIVRQQHIGEVGNFIMFRCQVSSGCGAPKIIKSVEFSQRVEKIIRRSVFYRVYTLIQSSTKSA